MSNMSWVCLLVVIVFCATADAGPKGRLENNTFSIETRVIVDRWALDNWTAIARTLKPSVTNLQKYTMHLLRRYIKSVFVGVNAILKGLRTGIGIYLDVHIVHINFVLHEHMTHGLQRTDQASRYHVLDRFHQWLTHKRFSQTDHTVLFTGLPLSEGINSHIAGVSFIGAMCTTRSLSAVEALPNGNTVLTFAHQLAHSLNVPHDGELSSQGCPRDSLMIMDSTRNRSSPDNFLFSNCSKDSILRFLQSLQRGQGVVPLATEIWHQGDLSPRNSSILHHRDNCLSPNNSLTPTVKGKPLGRGFDPDTICKMSVGPQSYLARTVYGPGGEQAYSDVCHSLTCYVTEGIHTTVVGVDGFLCASGKACSLGMCKNSSLGSSKNISATCPFGDPPADASAYKGLTCREVMDTYQHPCNSSDLARQCCDTCQRQQRLQQLQPPLPPPPPHHQQQQEQYHGRMSPERPTGHNCVEPAWCRAHGSRSYCNTAYYKRHCCQLCRTNNS